MDFEALSKKLNSLKNANIVETTPQELPDGVRYILRALGQVQESKINDYAGQFDGQRFIDATKVETLAHSIVDVAYPDGSQIDLRDISEIPTGEVIDGVAVKVPKHVFFRDIVVTWPEEVIDALYRKMLELKYEILNKVEQYIKLESDGRMRAARIENLSEQLRDLINDCLDNKQFDVPMLFDFRTEAMKLEDSRPDIPFPPPASEQASEDSQELTAEERYRLEQQRMAQAAGYDNLPEPEKQLLREELEEGDDWTPESIRQPGDDG